jgi:hypothetical protein
MLEYKFKVGDIIEMHQQTTQDISQNIMGMSQDSKNEISGTMRFEVIEIVGKDARIEAAYLSLRSKVSSAMATVNMDSEGDQSSTENRIMKSLTGKKFTFVLTSRGFVNDIQDAENLLADLDELGLDAATISSVKQNLQQQYTGQGLKGSLELGFVQYANKKVKPKDQWESEISAGMSFPLLTKNNWTFENADAKEAMLNSKANITTTDSKKTFPLQMGMKGVADLSGSQETKSNVSLQDGWPVEINIKNIISGNLTILAGAMLPENMDVPMEINNESVFTFVRK